MEETDDLPNLDHWKTVMEFTVERASLLMAGIDPFETSLDEARAKKLPRWKQAHGHALGIVSAIRQGLISPVVCKAEFYDSDFNGNLERMTRTIKPTDRDGEICLTETIITRASLVGWITTERVQISRPSKTVAVIAPYPQPSTFSEVAPQALSLPYYGHTSEGLEFVDEAIKQLWSTYDEDDPSTAPTQEEVIRHLREKGAGSNMADAVNLVLRPARLRRGGKKNNKTPTSQDQ